MKLNKIICIFCAVLILVVTCANISISAFASDDEDITFVEATKEEVLDFLYEYMIISAKSNVISFEVFCNMVNDEWGWTWNYDECTFTDVQTGVVYGITLDEVGMRGLARSGPSGGGGRRRVTSGEDIEISGETFADIVARLNAQYMPYESEVITMLTDKRWGASNAYADSHTHHNKISLYSEGYFAGNSNWTEIYMQPFYYDGSDYWVSSSQIHLFQEVSQDDSGNNVITMYHEEYSMFDSFDTEGNVLEPLGKRLVEVRNQDNVAENFVKYRYFDIQMNFNEYANTIILDMYSSNANYVSRYVNASTPTAQIRYYGNTVNDLGIVRKVSDLEVANLDNYVKLETVINYLNPSNADYNSNADIGFFVSNAIIKNGTIIIPENLDKEAVVTMGGNNIYEYTITNKDGDTNTVNEYITNNYTYITNNGSDDSGNSSGDVNVKGEIAVGGQVDVNVNINENSNTSMPVEVDVDNYIEVLPEQAKPVTNILALFFDFLPVELMSLVLAGVAVAIILRIWGR